MAQTISLTATVQQKKDKYNLEFRENDYIIT